MVLWNKTINLGAILLYSDKKNSSSISLTILLALVICLSLVKQAFPFPYPAQHLLIFFLLITYFFHCLTGANSRDHEQIPHLSTNEKLQYFLILFINLFLYLISFSFDQEWPAIVKQEILFAFFSILLTWIIFTAQINTLLLVNLVAWLCAVSGGIIACIGLYKFILIINGEILLFVQQHSSDVYPQGTSLVSDYNFYSLSLLISAIACQCLAKTKLLKIQEYILGIFFLILIFSAFLSGSRRLWILGPFCLFLVLFILKNNSGYKTNTILMQILLISISIILLLLFNFFSFIEIEAFISLWQRMQSLSSFESFSGRADRWDYVFELVDLKIFFFGMGSEYLYEFERKFTLGASIDYPHNPIYSALLYSGVIGGLAALYFYYFALKISIQLASSKQPAGCFLSISIFSQIIYSVISANSVFSIFLMLNFLTLAVAFRASENYLNHKIEVSKGN